MRYIPVFILLLSFQFMSAQTVLPVIKASSKKVAIRDGDYFDSDAWSLSPRLRPDVFVANRTRKTKWVVFYTDIDSIRVKVKPGTKFDFVVLLNGKDSCFTQIASAIPPENKANKNISGTHDTIPFVLTAYDAIRVKAISNDTDTLNLHFDLGSLDFHLLKDALQKNKKPLTLRIGHLVWNSPTVISTSFTAHDMDGRFGWNLFENKAVEIDYDKKLLIIHSKMPQQIQGFTKSRLSFNRSFICMKASFIKGKRKCSGSFLLDTGSDRAVIADSTWAAQEDFTANLKFINSTILKDPRGVKYETRTVLAPLLQINHHKLADIPTLVLPGKNPADFAINFLGNDLLKRFNMILDFRHDCIYMKPNQLLSLPYRTKA